MPRDWLSFRSNSLPIVNTHFRNEQIRILLDTGAFRSIVSLRFSDSQQLPRLPGTADTIIGIGTAPISSYRVLVDGLMLASIRLPSFEANVVDLGHLGLNVTVLLGVNAFSNRRLQFDFAAGRVYFLES